MKTEAILRWIVIGGLFALVLITPFIVTNSMFFPFITGKNFFFRIIVELIFFSWLCLAISNKKYRPSNSYIIWTFLALLVSLFVSNVLAVNSFKAFWSNYERMEGFVTTIHLLGLLLTASSILRDQKIFEWLMKSSLIASFLMCIFALYQVMGKAVINQGGVRVDGKFGNAAYFAGYLLFNFFFALYFYLKEGGRWKKALYALSMVLSLIFMYFTATRGAFVGLIAGVLIFFVVNLFNKENRKSAIYSVIGLFVVVVFAAGLFIFKDSVVIAKNPTLGRIASMSIDSDDAKARFMVWEMGLKGFLDKPIFGWGQENFLNVFNKYYNPGMYNREQWFDRAHNIFLDYLVAGGIFGFVFYLLMAILSVVSVWKFRTYGPEKDNLSFLSKTALTALITAYFTQNLFVFDNIMSSILFFLILSFLANRLLRKKNGVSDLLLHSNDARDQYSAGQFVPTFGVVFIVIVYFINIIPMQASALLIKSISPSVRNADGSSQFRIEDNLSYFEKTVKKGGFGIQEAREQLSQMTTMIVTNPSVSADLKAKYASLAVSEMEKQVIKSPKDARMRSINGSLLAILGNYEKSAIELEEALALSPRKQLIKLSLADVYFRMNKKEEALALAKSAYEDSPKFLAISLMYLTLSVEGKDFKLADEIIKNDFKGVLPTDKVLAGAYFRVGQKNTALQILLAYEKENPSDIETLTSISAIYLDFENRAKSIEYIQKAIDRNTAFKEQGEYYIKEIKAGRRP